MRSLRFLLFALICAVALILVSCGKSSDPTNSGESFQVGLLRIADLTVGQSVFTNFGTDSLLQGRIQAENEVEPEEGQMEVEDFQAKLQGAMANATYTVQFCSFAGGLSGCTSVGTLMTDGQGQGQAQLSGLHGSFSGSFVVSRGGINQFVSGVSTLNSQGGNFEFDLLPVGAVGGLGAGFTTGVDSIKTGQVEVGGGGNAEFSLTQAMANATYSAMVCPFGMGAAGCVSAGNITTNGSGNASGEAGVSQQGAFSGILVLERNNAAQFVSGFTTP